MNYDLVGINVENCLFKYHNEMQKLVIKIQLDELVDRFGYPDYINTSYAEPHTLE